MLADVLQWYVKAAAIAAGGILVVIVALGPAIWGSGSVKLVTGAALVLGVVFMAIGLGLVLYPTATNFSASDGVERGRELVLIGAVCAGAASVATVFMWRR